MQLFTHGSEDSLDTDVFFVVEKLSNVKNENKIICDELSAFYNVNGNLITIAGPEKSRYVSGCYKGTEDEVNNGLMLTYDLHQQSYPNPISRLLPRDAHQKMIRVIRGLLSQCSRTERRTDVKTALKSDDIFKKLSILYSLDIQTIDDFGKNKAPKIDIHKFIAFQIIQFLGLVNFRKVEIYTKKNASVFWPEAELLLYRHKLRSEFSMYILESLLERFIQDCHSLLSNRNTTILQNGAYLETPFGLLNVKTELYEEQF